MSETRSIVVEKTLPHPSEKIWRTLTESALIAKWLMPNDFVPVVGHRFTFKTKPMGGWDGIVHCEVTVCEPPERLRYAWVGGSDMAAKPVSRLDSTVTWTLTPVDGGTHVRMEHAGFRLPENQMAFDAMGPGWGRVLDSVDRVARESM